jgi:hypothetical protein
VTTTDEWRRALIDRCRKHLEPFDGRQQDLLLGFGLELARVSRGSRVVLRSLRPLFGERLTRRYVGVYVSAGLLELVERPTRGRDGEPGRLAVYELRIPPESLPLSPHEGGSDSCALKGQRLSVEGTSEGGPDAGPLSTIVARIHAQIVVPVLGTTQISAPTALPVAA